MTVTSVGRSARLTDRVAEEIRGWLGKRRMSQAQLARTLGQSQMWVSDRLRGEQELGLTDLERIADALGVRVVDLFPRDLTLVRARVAERPMPPTTRCAPDVRSPSIGGVHRRPKARQSATQPIAA